MLTLDMFSMRTLAHLTGVIVAMAEVTTGMDNKLEQNAVAAARLATSLAAVPVGSKHLARLSLARSSSSGEAKAGRLKASMRVPYCRTEAI